MIQLLLLACAPDPKPQDSDPPVETAHSGETGETGEPPHEGPFHPELDAFPRLVALPEDRETLLARVAGSTGDAEAVARWQALYAELQSSCASEPAVPEADPIDPGATWSAMAVARDCAFLAWLNGDAEAAAKAEATLLTLPPDAGTLEDDSYDVHLSTALGLAVQAWDLLAGADAGLDLEPSRAAVLTFARSFWVRYTEEIPFYFQMWQNNHNLKFAAGFGMAGIVFNTEDEAWAWASYGQTELAWLYGALQAADGGYGEGPYYQMYGAMQTLPYLRAWHRLLGDTGERFDVLCATRPNGTCEEGTREAVGDLWESEGIRAGLRWNVALRMPDGTRPPVDDGVPVGFPSAIVAEMDPLFGWDWANQQDPFVTWAGTNAAELLSAWDGSQQAPDRALCETLPESGAALLRDGWEPEDTWVMLLGEPDGPMVDSGHEHADAGSVQLYARGQYLLIDSGYPGWSEREATSGYEHHSGLLVDGAGPPTGGAGDLGVSWEEAEGCESALTLDWDGTSWTRALAWEGDALVLRDTLSHAGASSFELLFHTLSGEGRGTLELLEHGAVLRRDGVSLTLAVASPEGATLALAESEDALTYGSTKTHQLLSATIADEDEARLLTVLVLGEEDASPTITLTDEGLSVDGIAFGWER